MNNEQQNTHKKAYVAAQTDYLDKLAQHCDYALTLQTNLPTYGISAATMEKRLDAHATAYTSSVCVLIVY